MGLQQRLMTASAADQGNCNSNHSADQYTFEKYSWQKKALKSGL
jgi:hypothetical protein